VRDPVRSFLENRRFGAAGPVEGKTREEKEATGHMCPFHRATATEKTYKRRSGYINEAKDPEAGRNLGKGTGPEKGERAGLA